MHGECVICDVLSEHISTRSAESEDGAIESAIVMLAPREASTGLVNWGFYVGVNAGKVTNSNWIDLEMKTKV